MKSSFELLKSLITKIISGTNLDNEKESITELKNQLHSKFLEDKKEVDCITKSTLQYFFPSNDCIEKNTSHFWFEKYRNDEIYTEYNFALDIIKYFELYLQNKSCQTFKSNIYNAISNFGTYKDIVYFYSIVSLNEDIYEWIVAYLIKDSHYFNLSFDDDIDWLKKVQEITNKKALTFLAVKNKVLTDDNAKLKADISKLNDSYNVMDNNNSQLKSKLDKLAKDNNKLRRSFDNLNNQQNNLVKNNKILKEEYTKLNQEFTKIKEDNNSLLTKNVAQEKRIDSLEKRIDMIELRDTVKLSIKYLYNVLHYKFNSEKIIQKYYWDKVMEIKNILQKPEFDSFYYLRDFINDIIFGVTNNLNHEAHTIKERRNLDDIVKYMQINCNADLSKVVNLFKKFPKIDLFFELNMKYFFKPEQAEELFTKSVSYSEVYSDIFES